MSISIFIMGPTASGKTSLSIKLYKYLPIEIISVDSVLVYKYMNIGTDKPKKSILKKYNHHLINIKDPSDSYSVAEFYNDALCKMKYISNKGKIPLLVGGTMFYFKILLNGLYDLPKSNLFIRKKIYSKAKTYGWKSLYNYLKIIDPFTASKIHFNDCYRILRALEIFMISKKTLTEIKKQSKKKLSYKIFQFALLPNNKIDLKKSIKNRFYKMLKNGFKKEVSHLFNRNDLNLSFPSMKSVGYRQMWNYLSGKKSYNEMIVSSINETYKIAKRQITWINSWKNINIIYNSNIKKCLRKILNIVKKNNNINI